uniref:Uncharacterized protein n=1 Tax=Chrysemys picta bellii TaxID=8478 RepID=A0A8C3HX46_CHRPI
MTGGRGLPFPSRPQCLGLRVCDLPPTQQEPHLQRGPWSGLRGWPGKLSWVDTVWELDFTETEPLDSRIEEGITEDGLDAFSELYKNLYSFVAEDHGTTEVSWKLSMFLLGGKDVPTESSYYPCSPHLSVVV